MADAQHPVPPRVPPAAQAPLQLVSPQGLAVEQQLLAWMQAVAELAPHLPGRPPYPGAKNYPVADELLDDAEAVRALILRTASLMPLPKPKKPKAAPRKRIAPLA